MLNSKIVLITRNPEIGVSWTHTIAYNGINLIYAVDLIHPLFNSVSGNGEKYHHSPHSMSEDWIERPHLMRMEMRPPTYSVSEWRKRFPLTEEKTQWVGKKTHIVRGEWGKIHLLTANLANGEWRKRPQSISELVARESERRTPLSKHD